MRKTVLMGVAALCSVALVSVATSTSALANPRGAAAGSAAAKVHKVTHSKTKNSDPVIYDSTVQPNPGNLASLSYEATATAEFGNQITFGGTARVLDNVVVQMSSWGCESGNWSTYATAPCVTTPGATFSEPITLNIYNVGPANAYGPSTAGSPITSLTQTFNIPYRPSADTNYTTDCAASAAADAVPVSDFAGTWYDAALNECFNGYLTPIEFTFGHVVLPSTVIYGIAYDTSDNGNSPNGDIPPTDAPWGDLTTCHSSPGGCGYDSLNVAQSQEPTAPSVGTDDYPGTVYWNVQQADYAVNEVCNYITSGPNFEGGGLNVFRIDEPANYPTGDGTTSGCWSVNNTATPPTVTTPPWYVPAVQFNAVQSPAALITSANNATVVAGTPFSFTINTTGVPIPRIMEKNKLPRGLTFTNNGDGTGTIAGNALTGNRDGSYRLILRATNLPNGGRSRQTFTLTLTGGRVRR